jgi:hypothetical protein
MMMMMEKKEVVENMPSVTQATEGEVVSPGESKTNLPKFYAWTWGSFRRGYLKILHPKQINLFTPEGDITAPRGPWEYKTVYKRDLGFAKILIDNKDSRKNVDREITFVSVKEPVVVWYYGHYSASKSFSRIYLIKPDLTMEEITDIKNELVEVENGHKIYINNITYVLVNNNIKVVINKELVETRYKAYKVKLDMKNGRIYVRGDTYPIKDQLKQLGFRWDNLEKAWYVEDNVNVRQLLLQIQNVVIET